MPFVPKAIPPAAVPIDTDEACAGCGYNLRGLTTDKNCPECGRPIRIRVSMNDVLTQGKDGDRVRWRLALALLGWCTLAIAARQFGWLIWQAIPAVTESEAAWLVLETAAMTIALAWVAGVWVITSPLIVGQSAGRRRWLPFAVRWLTVLWIPAVVLQAVRMAASNNPGVVETAGRIAGWCAALAAVGGWLLLMLLHRLAEDAELNVTARRINNALWLLPLISLVMAGLGFEPIGFWEAILRFAVVFVPWLWFIFWLGIAVLDLHRHTAWGLRIDIQKATREERIAQRREEIIKEAGDPVRPVPVMPQNDVPVAVKRRT